MIAVTKSVFAITRLAASCQTIHQKSDTIWSNSTRRANRKEADLALITAKYSNLWLNSKVPLLTTITTNWPKPKYLSKAHLIKLKMYLKP